MVTKSRWHQSEELKTNQNRQGAFFRHVVLKPAPMSIERERLNFSGLPVSPLSIYQAATEFNAKSLFILWGRNNLSPQKQNYFIKSAIKMKTSFQSPAAGKGFDWLVANNERNQNKIKLVEAQ